MSDHVTSLEPPDSHFVLAAQGWLELGLPAESRAELERVSSALQGHPAVLDVRWEICAREKRWDQALALAQALIGLVPEDAGSWIRRSFALHELHRTQEAWDNLLQVSPQFPAVSVIPYNLACYACQMGRLEEARTWLDRAMKVGIAREIKSMALRDQDLAPMHAEIAAIRVI